jgi:hypothetical protein
MPKLTYPVALQDRVTPGEYALVLLMRDVLNDLRSAVHLPPLTEAEMTQRLWHVLRQVARKDA